MAFGGVVASNNGPFTLGDIGNGANGMNNLPGTNPFSVFMPN